jgi:class 3 adenylate cyclase
MSEAPQTQYVQSGDAEIAYQVVGNGSIDLVYVPIGLMPIDLIWDHPPSARNLKRLASFTRLILLDNRGYGSSERVPARELPAVQAWMDDILAVLRAAGSERASVLAAQEPGLSAMLLAASHPERVSSLVLVNCYARFLRSPQYPWGMPAASLDRYIELLSRPDIRGAGDNLLALAPSMAADRQTRDWYGRSERLSSTPHAGAAIFRLFAETDMTDVLPGIKVPTLVIARREAQHVRVGHGRFLAQRIPNAKYVELPGTDTSPFLGDAEDLLSEIEEFLTGIRPVHEIDRVLATVLFTDIVGSTELAARIGDRRWRNLLDSHDAIGRNEVDLFRGRVVRSTGDGMLATFDGPARAIQCARALRDAFKSLGIDIRAGLHTGELELREGDIGGIAVHIGARIAALASSGEVLVSRTVKDLVVGSGIQFVDRGVHALKGVPDEWQIYAVRA